jgi:hypothetical protein
MFCINIFALRVSIFRREILIAICEKSEREREKNFHLRILFPIKKLSTIGIGALRKEA